MHVANTGTHGPTAIPSKMIEVLLDGQTASLVTPEWESSGLDISATCSPCVAMRTYLAAEVAFASAAVGISVDALPSILSRASRGRNAAIPTRYDRWARTHKQEPEQETTEGTHKGETSTVSTLWVWDMRPAEVTL